MFFLSRKFRLFFWNLKKSAVKNRPKRFFRGEKRLFQSKTLSLPHNQPHSLTFKHIRLWQREENLRNSSSIHQVL